MVFFLPGQKRCSNLLAVSDEDGFVSFYDTRRSLPSFNSCREKAGLWIGIWILILVPSFFFFFLEGFVLFNDSAEARICDWIAHNNAVFDVCWIKVFLSISLG